MMTLGIERGTGEIVINIGTIPDYSYVMGDGTAEATKNKVKFLLSAASDRILKEISTNYASRPGFAKMANPVELRLEIEPAVNFKVKVIGGDTAGREMSKYVAKVNGPADHSSVISATAGSGGGTTSFTER
jgi:hypothetical protein